MFNAPENSGAFNMRRLCYYKEAKGFPEWFEEKGRAKWIRE